MGIAIKSAFVDNTQQKRVENAYVREAAQRKLFALSVSACVFYALFFVAIALATVGEIYYYWHHFSGHNPRVPIMIVLATGGFAALMAASVWDVVTRKMKLSEGVYVTRQQCPTLWNAVDSVATAANIAPPDKIVLLAETNAFAADIPENGILRKKTRVLGLGFPLLNLLTIEEAAAVITHEIGHFVGKDTLKANFHYAVMEVMDVFNTSSGVSLMGFVQKVVGFPSIIYFMLVGRLNAKVSQAQEYHADALAAELFGSEHAASALIALETLGEHMEKEIHKPIIVALKNGNELPSSLLATIDETVRGTANRDQMESYLSNALSQKTDTYASHPCLKDRLAALGVTPVLPAFTTGQTGAKALLWDDFDRLRGEMDAFLAKNLEGLVKKRQVEVRDVSEIIDAVYPTIDQSGSPHEAAATVSLLLERSLRSADALEKQQDLINRFGDIPSAVCELALEKLEQGNIEGADELLSVFERHPLFAGEAKRFLEALPSGADHIPNELLWLKDWMQSDATKLRVKAAFEVYNGKRERLSAARTTPENVPHGLPHWHVEMIGREISKVCDLRTVWLTRTDLPAEFGYPQFRMQVEVEPDSIGKMEQMPKLGSLCCLPGHLTWNLTEPLQNGDSPVFRKVRDFKGSVIYRKPAKVVQEKMVQDMAKAA